MLITKELDGKIYVAKVQPPVDRYIPGTVTPWCFIGPGAEPFITWISDTTYAIHFKYLSNTFVRKLDETVWPPFQVDPVTSYNPITIQRPEISLPLTGEADLALVAKDESPDLVYLKREDPYLHYDVITNVYWIVVDRDPTHLAPGNVAKYRLYSRDIGSPTWTLFQDWNTDISQVTISGTGSLTKELVASWGYLWASGKQNYPDDTHYKEMGLNLGPIIRVDSTVESRYIAISLYSEVPVPLVWDTNPSAAIFEPLPNFYYYMGSDFVELTLDQDMTLVGTDTCLTFTSPPPRTYDYVSFTQECSTAMGF